MLQVAQPELKLAVDVARTAPMHQSPNGIHYASLGDTELSPTDLEQMVQAVPPAMAAALRGKVYYFVPLTLPDPAEDEAGSRTPDTFDSGKTRVALAVTAELSDHAICHRNVAIQGADCVFISTRLMQDRFALAFEFFINVSRQFVDAAGVPESFASLAWSQVQSGVRGETSRDAWELRAQASGQTDAEMPERARFIRPRTSRNFSTYRAAEKSATPSVIDEKARLEYFEVAFADAIAVYLLSLTVDFDYTELREREYPLLAAPALAERLKHVAQLFPSNAGREFVIHYRRRNG